MEYILKLVKLSRDIYEIKGDNIVAKWNIY
jgi:hypothetical protein